MSIAFNNSIASHERHSSLASATHQSDIGPNADQKVESPPALQTIVGSYHPSNQMRRMYAFIVNCSLFCSLFEEL